MDKRAEAKKTLAAMFAMLGSMPRTEGAKFAMREEIKANSSDPEEASAIIATFEDLIPNF